MQNKLKQPLRRGLDLLADRLSWRVIDRMEARQEQQRQDHTERLLSKVRLRGTGIQVHGALHLSGTEGVAIGNNVHIEADVRIRSEGGLVIGDNTHIGRGVTIDTIDREYEGEALPYDHRQRYRDVIIGRNVWIGMNANIAPGTRIGDGAIIGMGATVSGVVPPLAVVAPPAHRVVGSRDAEHYHRLDAARQYGGAGGRLLAPDAAAALRPSLTEVGPFFVVSTGRSGSTTMARVLDQHPEVTCLHEPHLSLIRLSTLWAEETGDRERLRDDLDATYDTAVSPSPVYGESDQNLSLLLDPMLERFPDARIVWLIRDGRDMVASGDARGWYHPGVAVNIRRASWDAYRLRGDRVGDVTEDEWEAMSPFEKNCWYWSYVNRVIRLHTERLDAGQWMQVRLEDIADRTDDVFRHIGVEPVEVDIKRHNPSVHKTRPSDVWSPEEHAAFERICGAEMDASYPGWRAEPTVLASAPADTP